MSKKAVALKAVAASAMKSRSCQKGRPGRLAPGPPGRVAGMKEGGRRDPHRRGPEPCQEGSQLQPLTIELVIDALPATPPGRHDEDRHPAREQREPAAIRDLEQGRAEEE